MKAPEYRAEYAATNRSTCVRCHQGIRKNDVRLGIVVKADFEDGKDIQWHHLRCFFQRKPNVDVDKIRRFHDLLWTDQLRIRKLSAGRKDATDDSENETPSEDEDPTLKNGKSGGESDGEDGSLKSQSGPAEEGKDEASQLPIKAMKAISEENNQHDLITKKTEEAEEIREMSDDAENVNVSRVKQRKPGKHIDSKKAKPGKSLGKEKRRPGKPVDKDRVIIRLKTMLSSVNREAAALGMLGAKIEARVRLLEKENATLKAELEERSAQLTAQSHFHDGKDLHWHHPRCFFQKKPGVNVDEIWHFHDLRWADQLRIRKLSAGGKGATDDSENETLSEDEDPSPKKGKNKRGSAGKASASKKPKAVAADGLDGSLKSQSDTIWECRDEVSQLPTKALKSILEENNQHIPVTSKMLERVVDMLLFGSSQKCDQCRSETGHLVISADAYHCLGHASQWAKCDYKTQVPARGPVTIPDDVLKKFPFLAKYEKPYSSKRMFAACYAAEQTPKTSDTNPVDDITVVDGPSTSNGSSSFTNGSAKKSQPTKTRKFNAVKPLKGLKIGAVGKLSIKRAEMQALLKELGGTLVAKASRDTFVVISDEASIASRLVMLEMAEVCKVHVVPVEFLEECEGGKIRSEQELSDLVERIKINTWTASKPASRMYPAETQLAATSGLSSSELHRLQEDQKAARFAVGDDTMKVIVKNGSAVDPASDLDSTSHSVYRDNGVTYTSVMAKTDIQRGQNSFYKIQIIKHDKRPEYYLFRCWGRIGTTIGGNQLQEMELEEAIEQFEFHFMDKSGNEWKDRERFVKKHGKYLVMELDFGQEEETEQEYHVAPGSKTSLAKPIQELIKMIFDVEEMKKTMKEFQLDLRKMPLGKLSRKQITDGMQVLNELQNLVHSTEPTGSPRFIGATNRFFTLVPHIFGAKQPPILNQPELIKNKLDMLDNLLEIEVAFSILRSENRSSDQDPIDQHYEKLKCEIEVVGKTGDEFDIIQQYIQNTHAATHTEYKLKLKQVYKVRRQGEADRFAEFRALHNHKLLWHGSRATNYAGILSQGLRIAPPEAPVTGYMFGKGVYFADMVSKSANYCFTNHENPTGLLLLSDVALGNMKELKEAESITRLPPDFHSVKGCGQTHPDPSESIVIDDSLEVPLGHPKKSKVRDTSLLYNEYIVYKEAQVNLRYLLMVRFDYK